MTYFDNVLKTMVTLLGEKKQADETYLRLLEEAEHYNSQLKYEKAQKIQMDYDEKIKELFNSFQTVVDDGGKVPEMSLELHYTKNLSELDTSTLNNLALIPLSESELSLHFKKYKDNPLALRRLEIITKEKGFELPRFAKEFFENMKDYDYYKSLLDDFMRQALKNMQEVLGLSPLLKNIGADIHEEILINVVKNDAEKMNTEFANIL